MSVPVKHDMKFKVVMMTPEWAADLLKHNHPNNRRPKDNRINSYAREMASGLWRLTHQAVALDEDGFLVDGQNRLNAVVLANCEVPMVLATGVPRRAMVATDCGANRNVADAARISGKPLPLNAYAFVARSMRFGFKIGSGSGTTLSNQEMLKFIEYHHDAIDFAFDCLRRNVTGITQAPVRAVIARAYYRRNSRTRTRQFCEILLSGLYGKVETDVAAVRLRNWLLSQKSRKGKGGSFSASEVYGKTAAALDAFIREEPIDKLHSAKEELFPIPDAGTLEDVALATPEPSANGTELVPA